jgi:N-carbamoyl-L-amino-acid hydrolase
MGMIFIPSVDGISHSPREYSTPEAITAGANVLLEAVLRLDAARFDPP